MEQTQKMTQDHTARLRKGAFVLIAVIAALYVLAVVYMYVNQRDLLFKPSGVLPEPSAVGLADVEVLSLPMSDGTDLTVWSAPAVLEGSPTVLFFHGQSGNLGDRADRLREILNSGFGLLAPSYRGFPGSDGTPSEAAFVADGLALYDQLSAQGQPVVLHGQSLGTGVAAAVAVQRPDAELLVLEAPFTATVDVAAERYPWLPVSLLMHDKFATRDIVGQIEVPTLIFHGTEDVVVPPHHATALSAGGAAQLFMIDGGTHNDLWTHGLWQSVQDNLPQL